MSAKEIDQATGKQMCSHWFSNSQWQLPSEEDYKSYKHCLHIIADKHEKLSPLSRQFTELEREQVTLQKDYQELIKEYGLLRRPFFCNCRCAFYTDVWGLSTYSVLSR